MEFEGLLGALFVLYILGSMVAGFFRRARDLRRSSGDGEGPGSGRPGFPEVLDMEELEQRLRDLAAGRRPGDREEPGAPAAPAAGPEAAPPSVRTPDPATTVMRIPAVVPSTARRSVEEWEEEDEWDELRDPSWSMPDALPDKESAERPGSVPPAVAAFMERDNPWQAAFVIKEVLGPPRALEPHRGRPRF